MSATALKRTEPSEVYVLPDLRSPDAAGLWRLYGGVPVLPFDRHGRDTCEECGEETTTYRYDDPGSPPVCLDCMDSWDMTRETVDRSALAALAAEHPGGSL